MSEKRNCPGCGADIEIMDSGSAKTAYCSYCSSAIDLTDGTAEKFDKYENRPRDPRSALRLGMSAPIQGVNHSVIGRIRYRDNRTYEWWDEWLLLSENGQYAWLQEDDWDFTLMRKFTPKVPFDPNEVGDEYVNIEGHRLEVEDNSSATVLFFEGELTWKAKPGETIRYLDAWKGEDTLYSCEWTEDEILYFVGTDVPAQNVYDAFGLGKAPAEAFEEDESKLGDNPFQIWTAKLIKGPLFIYTLIFALLSAFAAVFVLFFGIYIQPSKTGESPPEKGSFIYGPYNMTAKDRVYRVDCTMFGLPDNRSNYCEISLLDSDREPVLAWDGDFWRESGRDSDGNWSESNTGKAAYFVLNEPGKYYVEVTPEIAGKISSRDFRIRVKERAFYNWPLWLMSILSMIYPGFVLLMWICAHGESGDED